MFKTRILVTGGAGFIGSNLIAELVKSPYNTVYSLDNYFTGSKDNHIKGCTYIEGSTVDIDKLVPVVDVVYHLGEYSRVEQSFDDIELVHQFNSIGTYKVLEYIRTTKAKLIYAGSSTKFADQGKSLSPYTWSKANNTELVKNYHEWYNIDYAIVYFYNVYGPREIKEGKYATLVALFNTLAREGKNLTVVSPGSQVRNFTHVEDTVKALMLVQEKGSGDEYGIGSDIGYSVLEVAKMFNQDIDILPERKGNRMIAPVVSDKTKALGWEAKHDLKDYINTLKETYDR